MIRQATTEQTRVQSFARWRACVIGLTLAVHLAFSFLHFAEPQRDAAEHHALATNLVTAGVYGLSAGDGVRPTARRMPLYPLLLAAIYGLAGVDQGLFSAPVVQAILMVCNVAMVIAIARRFFGDLPALLGGALVGFYQGYLFLPTELLSENLSISLLLLAMLLLTRPCNRPVPTFAPAFVVLGLLVLTRANAVALLPVAAVWAWRRLRGQPRRATKLGLFALCFVATLAPWWVRNALAFHRFIPLSTNGGWNFYLGHNEAYRRSPGLDDGTDYAIFDRLVEQGRTESDVDHELYGRGFAYARAHPAETATNLFRKAVVTCSVTTHQTWNLIFATIIFIAILALRSPADRAHRKTLIGLTIAAGLFLWVGQAATTLLVDEKGLAGVGVSYGLLGPTALVGLAIAFRRGRDHWLLPAVYLCQVAVCLIYVPIVRIRWSVDFIAILYAAVAICALATRLLRSSQPGGPGDGQTMLRPPST